MPLSPPIMKSKPPPPPRPPSILRHVANLDTEISLHLHNLTQPILPHSLLKSLEISGDGRLFFPIAISLFLSPFSTSPLILPFLADLIIGCLLDLILVGLIKHSIRRPRPLYNKNMSLVFAVDHWSFPSGHSSRVCFIAALTCLSSPAHNWIQSVWVNYMVCLWAVSTSVSRVLLGRHFVFDVVAGACLGVVEALCVVAFLNYSAFTSVFT